MGNWYGVLEFVIINGTVQTRIFSKCDALWGFEVSNDIIDLRSSEIITGNKSVLSTTLNFTRRAQLWETQEVVWCIESVCELELV